MNSLQKYCSPKCTVDHKTGRVDMDNLLTYDLRELKQIARGVFQQWVKKRDDGKPCVSCDKVFSKGDVIHASHFYPANQYPGLLFVPENCHASCDFCNTALGGNTDEYRKRLEKRIGSAALFDLQISANAFIMKTYKHSVPELIEIIELYNSLLKTTNNNG